MEYKYITENNLENRQNYMYSEYKGREFLEAYQKTRKQYIEQYIDFQGVFEPESGGEGSKTEEKIRQAAEAGDIGMAEKFVKSFEVRKRLYTQYDWTTWKPEIGARYDEIELYLLLGEYISTLYRETGRLKFLSCLLKLDDTILSQESLLRNGQKKRFAGLLYKELEFINSLEVCVGLLKKGERGV